MILRSIQLSLFLVVALGATAIGFWSYSPSEGKELFIQFGYWNILGLFAISMSVLGFQYGSQLKAFVLNRRNWLSIACCFAVALFLYTRDTPSFKIVTDELLLSNTAKTMHQDREPLYKETALFGYDAPSQVDKRPLLFPFLLSAVHDITGYRSQNAFYLNGALCFLFLLLLFSLLQRLHSSTAGYFGLLLAAATPLLEQNASNGGFETLNLIGILIVTLTGMEYWKTPNEKHLACFLFSTALFSHVRYESPFLVLPAAIIVALVWLREKKISLPWHCIIIPLFFIPIAWQQRFVAIEPAYWQYKAEGDGAFSPLYLFENLGHATSFLFTPLRYAPNNPVSGAIGTLSAFIILSLFLTRRSQWAKADSSKTAAWIFGLAIIAETLLILGFTYGQLDDPIVSRLGLPLVLLTIVCGAIVLTTLSRKSYSSKLVAYALMFSAFIFALTKYAKLEYNPSTLMRDRFAWVMSHHEKLPQGKYLYISDLTHLFELEQIENISHKRAYTRPAEVKLHRDFGTYDDVFVVQYGFSQPDGDRISKELLNGNEIGDSYKLETIDETQNSPLNFIRLSRVTDIVYDKEADPEAISDALSKRPKRIEHIRTLDDEPLETYLKTLP